MSFVFPTNASQVQAFAGALYGVQVGTTTMAQVNNDIQANGGLTSTLNSYYSATFGSVATATVASTVAANLGLTGAALTSGSAYIAAQLNAAAAGARGAVISNIVNLFGTLSADATFGAAATAWNTKVAAAATYTGASNVAVGTVVAAPAGVFALTSAIDSLTGTAGNDSFNADFSVTGQVSAADAINGGEGADKLVVSGFAGAAAATGTTETNTITFQAVQIGKFVSFGGLTLSVATADVTAANIALAAAGAVVTNVTKSGTLTGWTPSATGTGTVTFTSTTPNANVVNLTVVSDATAAATVAETVPGVAAAAATAQSVLPQLTSIETVEITNAVSNSDFSFAATTKAATGAELFAFRDVSALNAKTITVSAGQAVQLATGNSAGATAGTVTVAYAATAANADLVLSGYQTTGAEQAVTLTGAVATTVNINSTGAQTRNEISTLTLPATTTKLNVTGDKALAVTANVISGTTATTLAEIDASANSGGVTTRLAAATASAFKFTGGSGNDVVILADNGLDALTSGAQINFGSGSADKLGLFDTALNATETARINQTVGTDVLGLNAAITLEANTLTSIKRFSIDTTALTQTISGLQTGSSVSTGVAAPTSLTLVGDVGVSDVSIALAGSAAAVAVGTLVTTGLTNVTIASNGAAPNSITTLTNSDNSTFTITGAQALTMSLAAGTTVGSKIDGSASTGILTLGGSTRVASGDVIIGGSGADVITGNAGADRMTGGAGVDTFVFSGTTDANANGTTFGTNFDEITDFVVGTDKLQITGQTDVVSVQQASVQAAVTALGATATAAQIAGAMATANTTNLGVSFARFGNDTYVLFEASGAATGDVTDDVFIKLTGVTTLPTFAVDVVA